MAITNAQALFAGLALLNLTKDSWKVQFDGSPSFGDGEITGYEHSFDGDVAVLTFALKHKGTPVTISGQWDIPSDTPAVARDGAPEATPPGNGHPFIEPGFDGLNGSHVWLRYGVPAAAGVPAATREFRFQAAVNPADLKIALEAAGLPVPPL